MFSLKQYINPFASHKILLFLFLLPLPLAASWKAERIDTDADERLNKMICHSSGNLIAIGDDMTIIYSEDRGVTWDKAYIPNVKGWVNEDEYILSSIREIPGSCELVMTLVENEVDQSGIGGPDFERRTAVLSSTDNGRSWKIIGTFDDAALYWIFVFSDSQCILFGASEGIYEYKNRTIEPVYNNPLRNLEMISSLRIEYFGEVRFDGSQEVIQYKDQLLLRNDNKLLLSSDRGRSWKSAGRRPLNVSINSATIPNDTTIIAGCDNGIILLSEDQGNNWTFGKISKRDINHVFGARSSTWWVAGDEGLLAFSSDQGKSWTKIKTDCEEDLYSIMENPFCSDIWVCGEEGVLLHVYNSETGVSYTDDSNSESDDHGDDRKTIVTDTGKIRPENYYQLISGHDSVIQGIILTAGPGTCVVTINHHTYTGTTFRIQLPKGEHTLQITRDGYFPKSETIEIKAGEVEEECIELRKIKVQIAPALGLIIESADFGLNISIPAGILTVKNNTFGVDVDADMFFTGSEDMISLAAFFGHKFTLDNHISLLPSLAAGGSFWQKTIDTSSTDNDDGYIDYSTSEKNLLSIRGLGFFIQASINVLFTRSERWGFILRPSIGWIDNRGFHFTMRFGGIVWI